MNSSDNVLEQAETLFNGERLGEAVSLLQAEVERNSEDLLVAVRLADYLRRAGHTQQAIELYRRSALAYADQGALPFAIALYKIQAPLSLDLPEGADASHDLLRELVDRYQQAQQNTDNGGLEPGPLKPRDIPLFKDLSHDELEAVIKLITPVRMKAGMMIIKEGDDGASLLVITKGYVRVSSAKDAQRIDLARLGPGDFFGEWSLLTGEYKRHAWVEAETNVEMLELTLETLDEITERHPRVKELMNRFFRKRRLDTLIATIFPSLSAPERRRMAECLGEEIAYKRGQIIYREGETSKYMSIIQSGTVEIYTQNLDGAKVTLALLGPGQYFGEGGALSTTPRTASVKARTAASLHHISREDLVTSLVSHPELLNSLQGVRAERLGATLEKLSESEELI